jgi:hypothetical protein
MKSRFRIALLAVGAFLPAAHLTCVEPDAVQMKYWEADESFTKSEEAAQAAFRKSIAELFASADKGVVYLLDFETKEAPTLQFGWWRDDARGGTLANDLFPIRPYGATSKILAQRALGPAQIRKLAIPLSAMVAGSGEDMGALCHFPIHALRLWRKNTVLFESSFCWTCGNYYLGYPNDKSRWHAVTPAMQKAIIDLMPIPRKETERFQKAYPKASPLETGIASPK